jgi:hypothetical protein
MEDGLPQGLPPCTSASRSSLECAIRGEDVRAVAGRAQ